LVEEFEILLLKKKKTVSISTHGFLFIFFDYSKLASTPRHGGQAAHPDRTGN
jgi:hypothetical protein